jgi:inosine-uridine nucleoside N-ribohydrolase
VGVEGCYVHDSSAVAFALAPDLFTTRTGPVRVVEQGIAIGQTIQHAGARRYSQGQAWEGVPAQQVCTAVQAGAVLDLFFDTLSTRGGPTRGGR